MYTIPSYSDHTLIISISFENGDSILELLGWVFDYEIKLRVVIHTLAAQGPHAIVKDNRKYISDKKQITLYSH